MALIGNPASSSLTSDNFALLAAALLAPLVKSLPAKITSAASFRAASSRAFNHLALPGIARKFVRPTVSREAFWKTWRCRVSVLIALSRKWTTRCRAEFMLGGYVRSSRLDRNFGCRVYEIW
eukprot:438547_1